MIADDKAQSTTLKIETRREGNTLILECHQNDFFQGKVEENPYLNFEIVEKVIKQNKFEIVSKNKNQIRIQIYTAILELHSQEALLRKKLEEKLEALSQQNELYSAELQTMRSRVESLQQQNTNGRVMKWEQESLDSTSNFDANYIYNFNFNNGNSLSSVSVTHANIYFMYGSTSYSTSNTNRRINTTGWAVTRIMKIKFQ